MPSILITGSNRGLGLEWARHYVTQGWQVYATCRAPEQAEELQRLAGLEDNLSIHRLDVTRLEEIDKLSSELNGAALDILLNNAGVYYERWGKDRLGTIDYQSWQDTFQVNTQGPMRLSEALIDNIAASEKRLIVTISSHMGCIADITNPNDYAYRSSKTALNAVMKGLSLEVAQRKIGVLLLHPGWVRTRMGGKSAPLSVKESVTAMSKLVTQFHPRQSGHFLRYDGSELPW